MKKSLFLLSIIVVLTLTACGSAKEGDVTANGNAVSIQSSDKVADNSLSAGKEKITLYDGYYIFGDENYYNCNLMIKDGVLTIVTRGEASDGTTSEIYMEEGNYFAEIDGKKMRLGNKDDWAIECFDAKTGMSSYLTIIPQNQFDMDVARITKDESEELERIKREAAEQKAYEEQEKAQQLADAEAAKKEEEKKKTDEAKLAEKRRASGWMRGKVTSFAAGQGETYIDIEVLETNYPGLSKGTIIAIGGAEGSCNCINEFGFLTFDIYVEQGTEFEAIIGKHKCGDDGYTIMEQVR